MIKTFCCGDIHGNFNALMQCIERSDFDPDTDRLISLGDICDGQRQTKQVIDYLLTLPHFVLIRGNHDSSTEGYGDVTYGWALGWMLTGKEVPLHWYQGGQYTAASYDYDNMNVPQSHINLLKNAVPYFIDENNNLYVHGGFDKRYPINKQDHEDLMWNRDLVYKYCRGYAKHPVKGYNHVFLGHTSTQGIKHDIDFVQPITSHNLTAMDTGGGWNGKLTIMNVETMKYWQSDVMVPHDY